MALSCRGACADQRINHDIGLSTLLAGPPGCGPPGRSPAILWTGSSAWRPGQLPATEHVSVHVVDSLATLRSGIEDDPVTAFADALRLCYLGRVCKELT